MAKETPRVVQLSTTNQSGASDGVKCLIYAESGVGKTAICATAPSPFIISAESGILSLRKKNIERIFGVDKPGICYDIPMMAISSLDDLYAAYEYAVSSRYGTICLDSLSEIGETVLASEKMRTKDPRKAYGEMIDTISGLIRGFRDIKGKHVVMTAKVEAVKDELTGAVRWGPSMPGAKLGPQLPYFFDEVWRMHVGKDAEGKLVRYLQTSTDLSSVAKDRSGALSMYELVDLGMIFQKILGD